MRCKDAEKIFEKLPYPPVWFLRLQIDSFGQQGVFEIRERENQLGQFRFYRAEARLIWTETSYWMAEKLDKFQMFQNSIQVVVDVENSTARFGPTSQISMQYPGVGLGSALMTTVIRWLKTKFPEAKVLPGSLSSAQATPDNKQRRNEFYQSHGFDMTYNDVEMRSGSFKKDRAGDLLDDKPLKGPDMHLDDIFRLYFRAHETSKSQERHIESLNKSLAERNLTIKYLCITLFILLSIFALVIIFAKTP